MGRSQGVGSEILPRGPVAMINLTHEQIPLCEPQ